MLANFKVQRRPDWKNSMLQVASVADMTAMATNQALLKAQNGTNPNPNWSKTTVGWVHVFPFLAVVGVETGRLVFFVVRWWEVGSTG